MTTYEHAVAVSKSTDAELMGGVDDEIAINVPENKGSTSPRGARRASQIVASQLPSKRGQTSARRGSAMHSEGIAVLGGSVLQKIRADRQGLDHSSGGKQWEGMPPAFEGAAGLSAGSQNKIDHKYDPEVRDETLPSSPPRATLPLLTAPCHPPLLTTT